MIGLRCHCEAQYYRVPATASQAGPTYCRCLQLNIYDRLAVLLRGPILHRVPATALQAGPTYCRCLQLNIYDRLAVPLRGPILQSARNGIASRTNILPLLATEYI